MTHKSQHSKPRVSKDKDLWRVTFGKFPPGYSVIHFASWERAIEAANRGCNKEPTQAVFDETFLKKEWLEGMIERYKP